ncbi:conserved hypothetical phospatase and actin regulator 2 [Kluyveromyces marxianus DMKU3-1042]|uniref:Conserved hypothetical phospatase and actin regulator 2 n=1 Tax=Kluyveromyces marxianus (strain DMKU3-1042 / BCC 29191 / NBRC 104275) TaxID=1003335 RepID=W0TFA4_KLUMD|nr:conserved hypothetical phospatase and actin regulator 2 [Kluyveromyces marxianus DMKU3-1042]BAO41496.1 conserved hypothetical phospatase and actin regulator 2 [Kluyveromyces marxianus DMKU3-1042]
MEEHVIGYQETKNGVRYAIYSALVLTKSQWYDRPVALMADKLLEHITVSRKWNQNPYVRLGTTSDLFLYHNHPLTSIRLCGLVMGWKWKLIGQEERAFWSLDDCSSTILCQCSKSQLLALNLPSMDLSGWTIIVTGKLLQDRFEFKVSNIEVVLSLQQEIAFWNLAFTNQKLLEQPWDVGESEISITPRRSREAFDDANNTNYIQQLQTLHFQENELLLASPYTEADVSGLGAWNSDLLNSTLEHDLEDHQNQSSGNLSSKTIRQSTLAYLIEKSMDEDECTIHEIANHVGVLVASASLQHYLNQLEDSEIVSQDDGVLELKNLQHCYRYIMFRFQSLINVQIPHIKIKYEQIKQFCNLHKLPNKLILDICKYFFNNTHIGNLINWWIEPVSEQSFQVHFTYASDPDPNHEGLRSA